MAVVYYVDPGSGTIRPDRRGSADRRAETRAPEGNGKAGVRPVRSGKECRFTDGQYDFLRSRYEAKVEQHGRISTSVRRARHVMFFATVAFLAITYAAPGFSISLAWMGVDTRLTLTQVSVVYPLVVAYLILNYSRLTHSKNKAQYEARILDLELQRFGCPTLHSALEDFRHFSESIIEAPLKGLLLHMHQGVYVASAVFLALTVIATFAIAMIVAFQRGTPAGQEAVPWAPWLLLTHLIIATVCTCVAGATVALGRLQKKYFLRRYVASKQPAVPPAPEDGGVAG